MRKSKLVRLIILFVTTITLSGCIVWPYWWDDGGHGGGHGGEWHEGHRGHGDRY